MPDDNTDIVSSSTPHSGNQRRNVFVVHGRNIRIRDGIFTFLRSLDLKPIEWGNALNATCQASPYIGDIIDCGFNMAHAAIVLLTGDDQARLCNTLLTDADGDSERLLTPQPRPNVLLETGYALAKYPNRTILVQFGSIRPITDILGRHVVHCDGTSKSRRDIITRLRTANCELDDSAQDWLNAGDLSPPSPPSASHDDNDKPKPITSPLNQFEQHILLGMLYNGNECYVSSVGPQPRHIEIGTNALYDPKDAELGLNYTIALDMLKRRNFVRWASYGDRRLRCALSSDGMDMAWSLRNDGKKYEAGAWPSVTRHRTY